jgi:hypothetical protein
VAGDRVKVIVATNKLRGDSNNRIVLRFPSGDVTLQASSPTYCVGAPNGDCNAKAPAATTSFWNVVVANMATTVAALLLPAHQGQYTDQLISLQPRGGDDVAPRVAIPMLTQQRERLAAGDRTLALAWENGTPPYEVRLYRAGVATPVAMVKASGPVTRFETLPFRPGTYRVEITDAATPKGRASADFDVVGPETLPALPRDQADALADPSVPADLRTTLEAGMLAKTGTVWDLEAYQSIAPIAATYNPAGLLAYRLINGA